MASEEPEIGADDACPVDIEPGVDYATPPDWTWRLIGASQPSKATFHINHSEVTQVQVDMLRPSDAPPDSRYAVSQDVPIIVIDSLDKYWASESHFQLPSNDDTADGAKRVLLADLGGHFRLLSMLAASQKRLAPNLLADLEYLSSLIVPGPGTKSQRDK